MRTMLDHLTNAVTAPSDTRFKQSRWDIAADYYRAFRGQLDPAFDLWLVRMGDPLAKEPGTPEGRFCARVCRMAEQAEQAKAARAVPKGWDKV